MKFMKMKWNYGRKERDKPSESLKCGFCREMRLEELDKKIWFFEMISLGNIKELAKHYIVDLDEF